MVTPSRPCPAAARMTSTGNAPFASIAAACGTTSARANASTFCLNVAWAGEGSGRMTAHSGAQQPLENRPQPTRCLAESLGKHACLANHRDEVRVARPAGHQVDVHVVDDACAGGTTQVDAHIDPLRLIDLAE